MAHLVLWENAPIFSVQLTHDMTQLYTGLLVETAKQRGTLRHPAWPLEPAHDDVSVPPKLMQEHKLPIGALVTGTIRSGKRGDELAAIKTINGLAPDDFRRRTPFARLTALDPDQRFELAASGEMAMRVVDLLAPIGRGTRGLIVAPPKAGKTVLLEQIARGVRASANAREEANMRDVRILLLLIDERPEEVTHFRRALGTGTEINADVIASSNDQPLSDHVRLSELMLAHLRIELECGRNVVVLVDSLTRMVRAFNLAGGSGRSGRGRGQRGGGSRGGSRTLSGGVDANALELPRRFFGMARNVENGGSITIIATALVETNSRLDDLVFEEFKGTGNSEIVLSREMAQARVFPAIDLRRSGTRKEAKLYSEQDAQSLGALRRLMDEASPREAMTALVELLETIPTNAELLQRIGK